ncbi:CRISPR-associated endoribonuclease Cas6 [Actinoalloteichus hoggarensis]|uniref:CRISPR associated protein Cas6 n=1 Tax=Actinoalloteichus hoggarensis TaxID=1470176 RepID=A0A221W7H8_9PSEU|nr:CRISPR-associated endoribonuclease Cas6 [Actinoalloteichus hoggarensis]ASO21529.1 CRISPR associated protein Cas6 [Actinoalloteichus hoggarensis]MBB5922119.1 CRISPR-associated endoribonuclease Cas6 [Actinoalloteichus hoggarensis]
MRIRLHLSTQATHIPWDQLLRPGRGLIYRLLRETAPELGARLHESTRPMPAGHGAPVFPKARRVPRRYAAGGPGHLELGSPIPGLAESWHQALTRTDTLDWGGTALRLHDAELLPPPDFTAGTAEFQTETPVALRRLPSPDRPPTPEGEPVRLPPLPDLLPYEEGFAEALTANLRRKLDTLGLDPDITIDEITPTGPKRAFTVGDGRQTGATANVRLHGAPTALRALWSWGLGRGNAAGFGWIRR